MLKAVLALRAVPYPPTHNLALLLDLLREHGILFPLAFEDIRRLTPFAAELRYEDLPEELERPFDRSWAPWVAFGKYERGPNPFCANNDNGRL